MEKLSLGEELPVCMTLVPDGELKAKPVPKPLPIIATLLGRWPAAYPLPPRALA